MNLFKPTHPSDSLVCEENERKKYQWMGDGSQKNVITFDQVNYIKINTNLLF
jgi:hypothetical protein